MQKKNAVWPFTVVGRPPQEDTSFGELIHALTGNIIQKEIPGLKEIHAVDAAGVHPLLLAIGSERYTPYMKVQQPSEILTIANRILGTGQLSLAKFLFITADETNKISTSNVQEFFEYILERIDFSRDIHFQTNTTIDTLDYSGTELNRGSKVVFAAFGKIIRQLCKEVPDSVKNIYGFNTSRIAFPGVICLQTSAFSSYNKAITEIEILNKQLITEIEYLNEVALIIVCDDSAFATESLRNFLWITFTRCNPSHDIYGIDSFYNHKHWGCKGPLIIDARIKPHHAPVLEKDLNVERKIEKLFDKGGSLYKVLK